MAHDVEPDDPINWYADEYVVDGLERIVVECINEVTGDRDKNILKPDKASQFRSLVSEWEQKPDVVHVGVEVTEELGTTECYASVYAEKEDGELISNIETFYFYY